MVQRVLESSALAVALRSRKLSIPLPLPAGALREKAISEWRASLDWLLLCWSVFWHDVCVSACGTCCEAVCMFVCVLRSDDARVVVTLPAPIQGTGLRPPFSPVQRRIRSSVATVNSFKLDAASGESAFATKAKPSERERNS